jgi:hypothetical protein
MRTLGEIIEIVKNVPALGVQFPASLAKAANSGTGAACRRIGGNCVGKRVGSGRNGESAGSLIASVLRVFEAELSLQRAAAAGAELCMKRLPISVGSRRLSPGSSSIRTHPPLAVPAPRATATIGHPAGRRSCLPVI